MGKEKDIRYSNMKIEKRDEGELVIVGYALKFDRASEDLGFTEYLKRGCLDGADMSNVVALLNHDSNYIIGRTGKNLKLEIDDIGLKFEVKPPNTSYARDLIENLSSGLINKCSFAFTVSDDQWSEDEDGKYVRTINKIDKLYDVSIVTTPAYEDTEAVLSARTLEAKEKHNRLREIEIMKMQQSFI